MLDALNNWRLTRKMFFAFALIAMVMAGLGLTAVVSNRVIDAASRDNAERDVPTTASLARIVGYVREYRILMFAHLNARNPAETAEMEERVAGNHANMVKELQTLSGIANPDLSGDIAKLKSDIEKLEEVNARTLALSRMGNPAATLDLLKSDGKRASHTVLDDGSDLLQKAIDGSNAAHAKASSFASLMHYVMLALILASIGFLAFIWKLLNDTFVEPLGELTNATVELAEGALVDVPHSDRADELGEIAKAVDQFRLMAVAKQEAEEAVSKEKALVTSKLGSGLASLSSGDLTVELSSDFPASVGSLRTDFNEAIVKLREMIGSVSDTAAGIRTGSDEIAQAAEDLARRTESNAASLEETSAALAQIDDRLKATAKAAARTVERADQAIATVGGGRSIADEAVQAMERVRASATGIDSVIEGLDKIAFQTRVLAMNAAVEAGRAGDAGRGFAVVADLVSSLAMRAEEEAKRARDQLTVTQTDIVTAVSAVERVDGALADISGDVSEVHSLLGTMATDNQAQSAAITQISAAVGSMDQATQQNAAMVEETSAAARNLSREVNSLAEQAALFKVRNSSAPVARKAEKPAAKPRPETAPRAYVSPVKALPAVAQAGGRSVGPDAGNDDWSDF
ncbi:HAMP domain-containing methyl-accepting chemotaxis protein [Sphingomonas sp. PR090111-T3T-6A]|uniref:HAMP domain-containing methyl-accepting chemotaxis protein n=1 Tax=Sphingomonas sp. PR090111-T3T-6A TaxID=685778 RepID=UPI00039B2676|nr:methyl-accepting chemotaxis protein [Sphingomonas sp. PR090111-T3T-6A]